MHLVHLGCQRKAWVQLVRRLVAKALATALAMEHLAWGLEVDLLIGYVEVVGWVASDLASSILVQNSQGWSPREPPASLGYSQVVKVTSSQCLRLRWRQASSIGSIPGQP